MQLCEFSPGTMDVEDCYFSPSHCLKRRNTEDILFHSEEDEDEEEVFSVSQKIKRMKLPNSNNKNEKEQLIKIKTLTGQTIELHVFPWDKVIEIKERIEETQGIPVEQQRLILKGKTMADERNLAFYEVANDVLHLVLALRGG